MEISNPEVAQPEAKFDTITVTSAFDGQPQLNSLQFKPDTIRASQIAPIQVLSTLLTAGSSVPTGLSVTNTTTSESVNQEAIILSVHTQVYIGFIDINNRMPEVISSANYPHYDWESLYDGSGVSIENTPYRAVHKRQVRNDSGSTQVIIFQSLVRFIINNSNNVGIL